MDRDWRLLLLSLRVRCCLAQLWQVRDFALCDRYCSPAKKKIYQNRRWRARVGTRVLSLSLTSAFSVANCVRNAFECKDCAVDITSVCAFAVHFPFSTKTRWSRCELRWSDQGSPSWTLWQPGGACVLIAEGMSRKFLYFDYSSPIGISGSQLVNRAELECLLASLLWWLSLEVEL